MRKTRVKITADKALLHRARQLPGFASDSELIDLALASLLDRLVEDEGYDRIPLDAADEWGDLASWRRAVDLAPNEVPGRAD